MSACPQSFAGITVPEGEPGGLRSAAGKLGEAAGALAGFSGELRGMPATMAAWQGPASVSYAGSCMAGGTSADSAVQALSTAERAARTYGDALEEAQDDAERAIELAREAQERIDRAEREIDAARTRQDAAWVAASAASTELAITTLAGTPSPTAEADRARAEAEAGAAAADEARARRELDRARDDLRRAQERGRDAEQAARDAGRAAAAAFGGASMASPVYAALGAPAAAAGPGGAAPSSPGWWNTTNQGSQAWDEDQFLASLLFFHPENDTVGRYKWWGDQAAGAGADWASGAAVAYGAALRRAAIQDVPSYTLRYGRQFVAGRGGTVLVESLVATRGTTTVIDAGLLQQAGRYGKAGKAIPIVGGAVAIGSAGWDQWRQDGSNPNLSTTDRVGRSAGVGMYVGGASIAGAAIGTAIFPGVGTAAGLAIGATSGLVAGAVATSITPVKEAMADAGQWTANAAVDTWNWSGDRLQDLDNLHDEVNQKIDEGIDAGLDWAKDKLPDVDMPDLNPF